MSLTIPMKITTVTGVEFPLIAAVGDMTVDRMRDGLPAALPASQGETVGVTITVVSQSGADGQPGAQGAPGSAGAGANEKVDFDGPYSTDLAAESVLDTRVANLGLLPAGTLSITVTARGKVAGGGTGTWKVRIGGTDTGVDGTVVATLTVTSSSYGAVSASGSFTNPSAASIVKLTGSTSVAGLDTGLEACVSSFATAA